MEGEGEDNRTRRDKKGPNLRDGDGWGREEKLTGRGITGCMGQGMGWEGEGSSKPPHLVCSSTLQYR
ncbi:hypothetical protein Pmani_025606 [Petrolisthes manimaculis]|uniref:Uncharacterized protein n=1 Tax=Petrolisthes manimaculis TaxID=1843537 RepID=A0AAE1P556_9EUCA|nr:hypothetical protein Pmani_025606 [Petrolisthes manimaculis]